MNPRTERLLATPIVPTLARLSAPGVLLIAFQSLVSVGDTYFIGRLGTEPLAVFSDDPAVLDSGAAYLRTVAPLYPLLAVNIALYFASQGAGKVALPVLAGTVRLAIVIVGGAAAVSLGGIYIVVAAAMAVSGLLTLAFVARTKWT